MQKIQLSCVILVVACACNGIVDLPSGSREPGADPVICDGESTSLGPTPLRRLTREQYLNSVLDLFELEEVPATVRAELRRVTDGRYGQFANTTTAPSDVELGVYLDAAEALAASVGASGATAVAGCELASAGCRETFLRRFGRRAFRRPLNESSEDDELERYGALFDGVFATSGEEAAVQAVVTAMLSSASFLFREETVRDVEGDILPLTDLALATRLSFFLWQSGPDDELLDLAEEERLSADDVLGEQIARMIADPRSARGLLSFHEQWLGIDRLADAEADDPEWSPELAESMREETRRFIEHVMREDDGRLETLLSADYTFIDDRLAALYGMEASAAPFDRVSLPTERRGLLTQGSFLAAHGAFPAETRRGKFIRDRLLCAPPIIVPEGLDLDPSVDRLDPSTPCASCHRRMDPIGLGYADFDAVGRYFPEGNESTVRTEIVVSADELQELAGRFEGHAELTDRLATSPAVSACVTRQWFRFANGREETDEDACELRELEQRFHESGGDVPDLMAAIAHSVGFRSRTRTETQ